MDRILKVFLVIIINRKKIRFSNNDYFCLIKPADCVLFIINSFIIVYYARWRVDR